MRTLDELIDQVDDAWPIIEERVGRASRPVEILAADPVMGEATLLAAQVTTRSLMGAIALHAGAILVDGGWLRILGAGHPRVGGGLREWNEMLGGESLDPPLRGALLVAYDALGGFFAINGGAWPGDSGTIFYFAPSTRKWEALGGGYPAFFEWSMSAALDQFYEGLRWQGWPSEVGRLGPDKVISVVPPLGLDRTSIGDRSRRAVAARSQWSFSNDIARQLAGVPDGAAVRFRFTK